MPIETTEAPGCPVMGHGHLCATGSRAKVEQAGWQAEPVQGEADDNEFGHSASNAESRW